MVGRFYVHKKLIILYKMAVFTPMGRNPLGVIVGDEIISKVT